MKKRGLGRGLEALLSQTAQVSQVASDQVAGSLVPLSWIAPGPWQPRQVFDDASLQALADSIRAQGIINPLIVSEVTHQQYRIIAGERRWRAAKLAGLSMVPVYIKSVSTEKALAIALIENLQREDLNPLEQAKGLQRLIKECDMTHQAVAYAVGKSRAAISNLLRLLSLQVETQELLISGQLEMGHARALLALEGEQQTQAASLVVKKALSVRQTEILVKKWKLDAISTVPLAHPLEPHIQKLQQTLNVKLGVSVRLKHTAKGKGQLIIQYSNLQEIHDLLTRITI